MLSPTIPTEAALDAMNFIFQKLDTNRDGYLDKISFFIFLYQLGRSNLNRDQMESCWFFVNTSNTGLVDLNEFLSGIPLLYDCDFEPILTGAEINTISQNILEEEEETHSPAPSSCFASNEMGISGEQPIKLNHPILSSLLTGDSLLRASSESLSSASFIRTQSLSIESPTIKRKALKKLETETEIARISAAKFTSERQERERIRNLEIDYNSSQVVGSTEALEPIWISKLKELKKSRSQLSLPLDTTNSNYTSAENLNLENSENIQP